MNNETSTNTPSGQTSPRPSTKKPVVIYIMILCIAAFLLMALSFAMNQRSNEEAFGELETSFHATIAEIQETQERILALEKELDNTKDQLALQQQQLTDANAALTASKLKADAMEALYVVQQKYSAGLYQDCLTLIEEMENNGLVKGLSPIPIISETSGTITAPYNRYLQFKEAAQRKVSGIQNW